MLDPADGKRLLRADHERLSRFFLFKDVLSVFIVYLMAVFDRLKRLGVFSETPLHQGQHGGWFFDVLPRLCEKHKVPVIALLLHEAQRNRIRHAAVEILSALDSDGL